MKMKNNLFLYFLFLFVCSSCYRVSDKLEPKMDYTVEEKYLRNLESAFPVLSEEERKEDWGKELIIAVAFAHQLDLYRALFSFKRADILLPVSNVARKLEIQYDILLCYYFGKKYKDVLECFERSDLPHVDRTFPAFHDLLVILYESYKATNQKEKTNQIYELIHQSYTGTAERLSLSTALLKANFPEIRKMANTNPPREYLVEMLRNYDREKKSVNKAQILNVFLPGAGYLYVGQTRTAITAFTINALFIAAAYHFFHKGHIAAGIITTSLETGWYFGGIYGAGEEAKYYNEQVYTKHTTSVMNQKGLFPIFMIQHAF